MTTYDPSRLTGAQQNMADLIVRRCDDSSMNAAFFLALAVTESSLNPNTLGDDGISVGLFQINKKFQPAGTTISELDNPDTNITDAFVLFNSFLASWPGQTWGDYAEAWTEGGHARFDLGRRNPAKITHMQKAIDDLVLNLDLSASVA